jgi:hypothetical protein
MHLRHLLPALFAAAAFAAESPTFTDRAAAGPDFAVQGEYIAEQSGAQVIALGDGKFHIVGFSKGLPGVAPDFEKKVEVDAATAGADVVFDGNGWKGSIASGTLTGTNADGKTFVLKKTERASSTLGAKPPGGAVVLFDGKNADAWLGGKVNAASELECGVLSKQMFGDGSLHVEFRTPFKPAARGQERGNSGVYLQDRFEVQVLDSFGLDAVDHDCGGIYSIAKPKINMCFPPLAWQTYDIEFEAARFGADGKKTKNAVMTVKHNGVLIHDHVELPHTTTAAGRAEGADPGPIQLQNHGNPVVYRNIWFMEKK